MNSTDTPRRGDKDGRLHHISHLCWYTQKRIQGWPHIPHQLSALRHRKEGTGMAASTTSSVCASTHRGYRNGRLYRIHPSVLTHKEDTGMATYTVSIHLRLYAEKRIQGWPPLSHQPSALVGPKFLKS